MDPAGHATSTLDRTRREERAVTARHVAVDARGELRRASCAAGAGAASPNLALLGDVTLRDDGDSISGISGFFGTGSRITDVWVEHFTTGA